ncbi:MAG: Nif3-like dinuclear metal center hexameric protein [Verrucomicrobiota bacterium]|nr:Nif3-like dinuclear metal center hexameric protein [Verrucomicrobiota bacterium]|tara:strand:- start:4796 stop:5551 length:756 start_codon:yes stop_codon:yes gene_type:complete
MARTIDLTNFCDERLKLSEIKDFPGAWNGLQIENDGEVKKIGAAVDAGMEPFELASQRGVDFLIVHHGLFWTPPTPLTGANYNKIKHCLSNNLAVYGAHLPLDCHPSIGNNAIIARKLSLEPCSTFLAFEGNDIGLIAECRLPREDLHSKLHNLFPLGIKAMEFGSATPSKVAILSGSGQSALNEILDAGSDTLVTGELKQQHFNLAQELKLNLYACGHYATEVFGVDALASEVAGQFGLPYEFVETHCPL